MVAFWLANWLNSREARSSSCRTLPSHLRHQVIQLLDISLSDQGRSPRIAVPDSDGDDLAFAVFGNVGVILQALASVKAVAFPIDFSQVEPVYDAILHSAATQEVHKQSTRAVKAKQAFRQSAYPKTALPSHGR
jgi:hypothetical protein